MILNELDENDDCCQRRLNVRSDHANELHLALDCSKSWRVSEELERVLLVVVVVVRLLHADSNDSNVSNDHSLQTADDHLASPGQIASRRRSSSSGNITSFVTSSLQQQRAAGETTSHQVKRNATWPRLLSPWRAMSGLVCRGDEPSSDEDRIIGSAYTIESVDSTHVFQID